MTALIPSCLQLLRQEICCALALALASAGNSMAAKMAMMAMTTSNSIKVNARALFPTAAILMGRWDELFRQMFMGEFFCILEIILANRAPTGERDFVAYLILQILLLSHSPGPSATALAVFEQDPWRVVDTQFGFLLKLAGLKANSI